MCGRVQLERKIGRIRHKWEVRIKLEHEKLDRRD